MGRRALRAARFAPGAGVVPPGAQAAALADLPVRALRLDPAVAAALARVGIEQVGRRAAQPRGQIAHRFGAGVLLRLDRATGAAPEPLDAVALPDVPVVRLAFAEPISAPETVARVAARLLASLCEELTLRGARGASTSCSAAPTRWTPGFGLAPPARAGRSGTWLA